MDNQNQENIKLIYDEACQSCQGPNESGRLWSPSLDLVDLDGIGLCLGELIPNEEDGSGSNEIGNSNSKAGLCLRAAFAPDESYFAWISGSRKVVLVPWNSEKNTLFPVKKSEQKLCPEDRVGVEKRIIIECSYPVLSVVFGKCQVSGMMGSGMAGYLNYGREELYPDRKKEILLATGHTNGRIRIWNLMGKHLIELTDHRMEVRDLAFAPDESPRLVSASIDGTLKCWDLEECNMFHTFRIAGMYCCKWSPNSKLLASCGLQTSVYLWDMENYKLYGKLDGHQNDVLCCDFSPDGSILCTASKDTQAILWDPYTLSRIYILRHLFPPPKLIFASGFNAAWVKGVSFSRDGMNVVTIADDSIIRFWNLLGNVDPRGIVTDSDEDDLCVCYSPSGRAVAVGTRKHKVSFYAVPSTSPILKHLARMAIRKRVPSTQVSHLDLPASLQNYLMYRVWN